MTRRRWTPKIPRTARSLQSIAAADLPGVQKLLTEGKLSLLTVGIGRSRRQFLVPADSPATPSSTAQTEQ
jgi:hypothetical protein